MSLAPAVVPACFTLSHVMRAKKEGMGIVDEEAFVVGLLVTIIIASLCFIGYKNVAWCIVLPPMLLVLIGSIYQRIRHTYE